jgi:hypothetical protein
MTAPYGGGKNCGGSLALLPEDELELDDELELLESLELLLSDELKLDGGGGGDVGVVPSETPAGSSVGPFFSSVPEWAAA